jgi:hypothetical protein
MTVEPSAQIEKISSSQRLLMWNIAPSLADSLFAWSNAILVVGAAAVLIGTIGSIKMSGIRERYADLRISENERATAQANASASQAQLELTKLKAPRSITDGQIATIREKMRAFSGQPFGMITYWNLDEPTKFTQRLGNDALVAAGWHFMKAERFEALIGVVTGIEVELSDDADESFKKAASGLVAALEAEGIPATLRSEPAYKALIKIQVGMKP